MTQYDNPRFISGAKEAAEIVKEALPLILEDELCQHTAEKHNFDLHTEVDRGLQACQTIIDTPEGVGVDPVADGVVFAIFKVLMVSPNIIMQLSQQAVEGLLSALPDPPE